MIEFFGSDQTSMFVLEIQAFCEANTAQSISKLSSCQYDLMMNNSQFLESFNNHKFFSISDLETTELAQITSALSQKIETAYLAFGEDT